MYFGICLTVALCILILLVLGMWLQIGVMLIVIAFYFLQTQHDDLEAKFFEEKAALEAKYQKLYQPLYTKVMTFEHLPSTEFYYGTRNTFALYVVIFT